MSGYALLSEVYKDEHLKPKKRGKKKKKALSTTPPVPMRPQEMETELLDDNGYEPSLQEMRSSPYDPVSEEYQHIQPRDYVLHNENIMKPYQRPFQRLGGSQTVENGDDPEYREFLEYKRSRQAALVAQERARLSESTDSTLTSSGDQFNELLLYMFTGFFLLILYDNIYKLGRDSYWLFEFIAES